MTKKVIVITVSDKYEQLINSVERIAEPKGKNKLVPTLMELVQLGLAAHNNGYKIVNTEIVKEVIKIEL